MWVRLRFDIGWSDLALGICSCFRRGDPDVLRQRAEHVWSDAGDAIVCLSARSGFDLLLQSLRLPPGSEVLLSALTVPDMARVVERHGLVAVPVDLARGTWSPSEESLRRAISRASKVLVVAHLFGTRVRLGSFFRVAQHHGLTVVEDCAQIYSGREYLGHPDADVSLFSFGPIKTATAFGGGVIRVRYPRLRSVMRATQTDYPVQYRRSHLGRLLKYGLLKAISSRAAFGAAARAAMAANVELDNLLSGAARNFPGGDLPAQLRRRPSAPLLRMLLRRWRHFDAGRIRRRTEKGGYLAGLLDRCALWDDMSCVSNSFWVFPIRSENPALTVDRLRKRGFDATRSCRLSAVAAPGGRPELEPRNARELLSKVVFLPWYPELPIRALRRLAAILREESTPCPPPICTGAGRRSW
jgi:perosamine synthetase